MEFVKIFIAFSCILLAGNVSNVHGRCDAHLEKALLNDLEQMMLKVKGTGGDNAPNNKPRDIPAFTAYRNTPQPVDSNTVLVFDKTWTNSGNAYNPSTGIFTVKIAGLYHFGATIMSSNDGKTMFVSLYKGNSKIASSFANNNGYETLSFDLVLRLEEGDTVSIKSGYSGRTVHSNIHIYSTFSGFLISL